jgi:hypothetical protein
MPNYTIILQDMVNFSNYTEAVVVGLLLSDAWLQKVNKAGQARLGFKQSFQHIDYLLQVFFILTHYCKSFPKYGTSSAGRYAFLSFTTRSLACFTDLFYLFYVNGVKVIPANIYEQLTIQGLAHVICGEGSRAKGGGLYLQTQCFSLIDNVRLINVLIIKFDCKCSIHLQRGLPTIYISAHSVRKLAPLLVPHMVPSMHYKLGL